MGSIPCLTPCAQDAVQIAQPILKTYSSTCHVSLWRWGLSAAPRFSHPLSCYLYMDLYIQRDSNHLLSLSFSLPSRRTYILSLSTYIFQMQASVSSLSISYLNSTFRSNIRFCGLRLEAPGFQSDAQLNKYQRIRIVPRKSILPKRLVSVSASTSDNGSPTKSFDYDLVIIGAGVGGHGAALHAVEKVWIL